MCFGLPARNKNKIGLKKIPPPIPTTPEINPNIPPIKTEIIVEVFMKMFKYNAYSISKRACKAIKLMNLKKL